MDYWIFPDPDYPDRTERVILVDMDDREPLRDKQVTVLQAALNALIKERDLADERIRKVSLRLVLSGEEKLRRQRGQ